MKRLYIIAGPNGAGKTTASFSILPEILDCHEFVNADEIARGLSPFNPDSMAFKAGRLMLERIQKLMDAGTTFAFETTMATRSYGGLIRNAQQRGYEVVLLFLTLSAPDLAIARVAQRVKEGGHNIPVDVIRRRFDAGLRNLFQLYMPVVDKWVVADSSAMKMEFVATGTQSELHLRNESHWNALKFTYHG